MYESISHQERELIERAVRSEGSAHRVLTNLLRKDRGKLARLNERASGNAPLRAASATAQAKRLTRRIAEIESLAGLDATAAVAVVAEPEPEPPTATKAKRTTKAKRK